MAGFKAADEVEKLDFDFAPFSKVKGTVPEPTTDQIVAFRQALATAYEELGLNPEMLKAAVSGEGDVDLLQHFGELMGKTSELEDKVKVAVAELCGGIPTLAEIEALPYRPRAAFLGWITGVFFNPEM